MPTVSIIVPAYNAQNFINRCVESILNQSFTDFELILVDDGSLDETGEICDGFAEKDSRVKVIHKENGGVSQARNAGIEKACGKYIMFVDGDDYISENMLSDMVEKFTDSVDMVIASIKMVMKEEAVEYCMKNAELSSKDLLEDFCSNVFPRICLCGPCVKLYKKEIVDNYCIRFDKSMSLGEDTVFNMSYLKCCKSIATLSKPHYFYMRDNENSLFSKFRDNWYSDTVKAYEATLSAVKELKCSQKATEAYLASHIKTLVATLIVAVRTSDMKECVSYMKLLSKDKVLCENATALGKGSLMYCTVKAIQMKLYYIVYPLLRIRYKRQKG